MKIERTEKVKVEVDADLSENSLEDAMIALMGKRSIARTLFWMLKTASQNAAEAFRICNPENKIPFPNSIRPYVTLDFDFEPDEWAIERHSVFGDIIYIDEIYSTGA